MRASVRQFLALTLLFIPSMLWSQTPDSTLTPGRLLLGMGFLGRTGDIDMIWSNGFSLDALVGYSPWTNVGFEVGGVYASTGITGWMKNKVGTVTKGTGVTGTSETSGGDYFQLFLGPTVSAAIAPGLIGVLSGGASRYGSREAGMSNIEDYSPRWTFGWGYYAGASISLTSANGTFLYGLGVRFTAIHAKVNDFVYDRIYGAMGYDEIPATYVWDRRIEIELHVGFGFR
jgi:hypothetical protein